MTINRHDYIAMSTHVDYLLYPLGSVGQNFNCDIVTLCSLHEKLFKVLASRATIKAELTSLRINLLVRTLNDQKWILIYVNILILFTILNEEFSLSRLTIVLMFLVFWLVFSGFFH